MTCVVGIKTASGVILAADSLGSGNGIKQEFSTAKLIRITADSRQDGVFAGEVPIIIGYTHSFRMGNIIKHCFKPPDITSSIDDYLVSKFIPELMRCFEQEGFAREDNKVKSGGEFLLGIAGRLFTVQSDYSVLEPEEGYTAIGSGQEIALGALFAYEDCNVEERDTALGAVSAASKFSTTVGGTVHTVCI
jgi:ATP-dependent protease HslVU (ClpYQ) peptidase subunit